MFGGSFSAMGGMRQIIVKVEDSFQIGKNN